MRIFGSPDLSAITDLCVPNSIPTFLKGEEGYCLSPLRRLNVAAVNFLGQLALPVDKDYNYPSSTDKATVLTIADVALGVAVPFPSLSDNERRMIGAYALLKRAFFLPATITSRQEIMDSLKTFTDGASIRQLSSFSLSWVQCIIHDDLSRKPVLPPMAGILLEVESMLWKQLILSEVSRCDLNLVARSYLGDRSVYPDELRQFLYSVCIHISSIEE